MEDKICTVKLKAYKTTPADFELRMKVKKDGKLIASSKRTDIEADFECIVFTPEKKRLREEIFDYDHYKTCTELPYRFRLSERLVSTRYMFSPYIKVKNIDVSKFDTSRIINMEAMFSYCEALEYLDLRNWDTSKVSNFHWTFNGCKNLKRIDGVIDLAGLPQDDPGSNIMNFELMFPKINMLSNVKLKNVPKWFMNPYRVPGRNITQYGYEWMGLKAGQFEIVE